MKHILIVGADEELSESLSEVIGAQGAHRISHAMTVRESCLLVAQENFDLVLAPQAMTPDLRRALLAMKPALKVVAVGTPGDEQEGGGEVISAVDPASGLEPILALWAEGSDLQMPGAEEVAGHAATIVAPIEPPTVSASGEAGDTPWPTHVALDEALLDERIAGALLTKGAAIAATGGRLKAGQLENIARQIRDTWREDCSALLQFIPTDDHPAQLLLFTTPVSQSRLLTVAALPDCSLKRLRRATETAARRLEQEGAVAAEKGASEPQLRIVDTNNFHVERSGDGSFALILTPRRPMPAALQAAVAHALGEVATSAGCSLYYKRVDADIVHFVSSCPEGRNSGWLAQLYKDGVARRIQEQFGVQAQLWKRGFYAAESERPLTEVELKLFSSQQ